MVIAVSECFYLVKKPSRNGGAGKWHLFNSLDSQNSVCGQICLNQQSLHSEPRKFRPGKDDLEDVKGLGSFCKSCEEYLKGVRSGSELPKPTKTGRGSDVKTNILDRYKRRVEVEK